MLEGLDDINWSELQYAYGVTSDFPDRIRGLFSGDVDVQTESLSALEGEIYHQGSIYQATAYTVPFLIAALTETNTVIKGEILAVLADVRRGLSWHAQHESPDVVAVFDKDPDYDYQGKKEEELKWVRQSYAAVDAGYDTYLSLMDDPDSDTRIQAKNLLSVIDS